MKCPGQDTKYWKENAIYDAECPKCGSNVEFFKDDTIRKCKKCEYKFLNPSMDFGCASYCEHAAECIGDLPSELLKQKENLLKERVAIEIKKYFKTDFKRISYTIRIARHAENIGKNEANANLVVVLCAAYLYEIALYKSEKKCNSKEIINHKIKGLSIIRTILEKFDTKSKIIEEVCYIIKNYHYLIYKENINYKILHDSILITKIEEEHKNRLIDSKNIKNIIYKSFMTDSGKKYAKKILLKNKRF